LASFVHGSNCAPLPNPATLSGAAYCRRFPFVLAPIFILGDGQQPVMDVLFRIFLEA
jgi:hypothetical protein